MTTQINDTDTDNEPGTSNAPAGAVREKAEAARAAAADAYGKASEKLATAYSTSVDKAVETVEAARLRAAEAARRAADGIDQNPVAALVGGLALGAIMGVLLPGTRKEAEMLGPLGSKVGDAAKTAAQAARDTGREALDQIGVNRDSARDKVSKIVGDALKVAGEAGSAAAQAVRKGGPQA